jgi:hypothetical protein
VSFLEDFRMPWMDVRLAGALVLAMLLTQAVCWLLARGLGLKLARSAAICAWIAPLVVLAPRLLGNDILAPTEMLFGTPGAPPLAPSQRDPRHALLNDTLYQLLPWELEVRHAFADRRLPFWSDTLEGGSSPWANPQAGVFSPLQMVARVFPIQHMLLGELILKLLLAFEGTWLLARLTGRSHAASLLAAAGFTLGGGLFAWALFPITATVAWVPWLAAGVIRIFRRPGARVIATTAAITAALLLSGHPETAAFGGLFAAVCGFGLRRRAIGLRRGLGAAALAALLGFGLAAPLLLPFLAIVKDSQRGEETLAKTVHPGRMYAVYPPSWFESGYADFLLSPLSPHAYGRPYQDEFSGPFNWADSEASYTGLVALAAALTALFARRDRRAWPFLGCALAGPLLAARFLPLTRLLHAIPPLRMLAWSRCLPPAALALCIAGAFGIDLLLSRSRLEGRAWVGFGLAAALSLAVVADAWTFALWALLAGAALAARWRPRWGAAALAAVLLLDLVPWSRSFLPAGHPGFFYPRTDYMRRFASEAGDPAVWRATGGDLLVYPNVLPVYGIAEIRPHNPLTPACYVRVLDAAFGFRPTMAQYFAPLGKIDHPLLDFLGVKVVAGSPALAPSLTMQEIDPGRYAPFTMLRNPDALPRWFFPRAVDVIRPAEIRSWIMDLSDPRRVAVLDSEADGWRPAGGESPPLQPLLTRPGHIILGLSAERAGGPERLLATSIVGPKGWSARAGGRRLRTLTVDGAFLGVRIPAGASRVELRFLPPGLIAGCAAFALSFLTWLALIYSDVRGRGGSGPGSGGRGRRRSLRAA